MYLEFTTSEGYTQEEVDKLNAQFVRFLKGYMGEDFDVEMPEAELLAKKWDHIYKVYKKRTKRCLELDVWPAG